MYDENGVYLTNDTLTDEEQQRYFPLNKEEFNQWQTWVPEGYKITNMQIYEAKQRGIPIPNGNSVHDTEYIQFLNEHVLLSKSKTTPPIGPVEGTREPDGPRGPIVPGGDPIIPIRPGEGTREPDGPRGPIVPGGDPIIPIRPVEGTIESNGPRGPIVPGGDPIIPIRPGSGPRVIPPQRPITDYDRDTNEEITDEEKRISIDEIMDELKKRVEEDNKNVLVKITRLKRTIFKPLLLAAIMAMLFSSLKYKDNIIVQKNIEQISMKTLEYIVDEKMSYEEAFKKVISDITMGDMYYLENGQKFNTNSRMSGDENVKGVTKELGVEFDLEGKYEGMYPITGFSIIRKSTNEEINSIEDFYEPSITTNLSDFLEESLKETGLGYEDIRIEFHFGRTNPKTGERSRLGWLDNGNLVLDEESIEKSVEDIATYDGMIQNFSGNYITIKNGQVKIPVKDENGNYYKPGTIVKGSDGKEYEISHLYESEQNKLIESEEQIVDGKKLFFDIKNCSLLPAIPFLAAALIDYFRTKKINNDAQKDPYYKFVNKEQFNDYIDEFQKETRLFNEIHKAIIYSGEELEQVIKDAYYNESNIKVYNINELYYFTYNNKILVSNKERKDTVSYDITRYIETYLSTIIANVEGYDKEAAAYFEETKGRGGR